MSITSWRPQGAHARPVTVSKPARPPAAHPPRADDELTLIVRRWAVGGAGRERRFFTLRAAYRLKVRLAGEGRCVWLVDRRAERERWLREMRQP